MKLLIPLLVLAVSSYATASIFSGGHTVKPPEAQPVCGEDLVEGRCFRRFNNCTPNYVKYCINSKYIPFPPGESMLYHTNCFHFEETEERSLHTTDFKMGSYFEYVDREIKSKAIQPKEAEACLERLVPLLCLLTFPICNNKLMYIPCYNMCVNTHDVCSKAGVDLHSFQNCTNIYNECPSNSKQECQASTQPSPSPKPSPSPAPSKPSGLSKCNSTSSASVQSCNTLQNCPKFRDVISGKRFDQSHFAAHVKIIEEVHYCSGTDKRIAYTAIVNETYYSCKTNCSDYAPGNTITILTDEFDQSGNCRTGCLRNKIYLNKEYLLMGTTVQFGTANKEFWLLNKDTNDNTLVVIYPWEKARRKSQKFSKWSEDLKKCKCSS